jgi:cysteine-rich repeat protein
MRCVRCPEGYETASVGSANCTNDACILGTHDCDAAASCESQPLLPLPHTLSLPPHSTASGFVCRCPKEKGFPGSGKRGTCRTQCGDGIVAGEEECDDGAVRVGDGCSDSCLVEQGFRCMQQAMLTSARVLALLAQEYNY